jgi:cyclic pyranopterin monophosphate synthase
MKELTHLDAEGRARMVNVGDKPDSTRYARTEGFIRMTATTLDVIVRGALKKGDVIAAARIAGIMAAKRTPELIPLCHPLVLNDVGVEIEPDHALPGLRVLAWAEGSGKTGVEMEALTATTVALLTIYDMAKSVEREMEISRVRLIEKRGGKSGDWSRTESSSP